jgi:transcriptional regulator with XRE-family HTH domain
MNMATDSGTGSRSWSINNPADLGRAIAGVRAERGLTQEGLARAIAVERGYLARLEAGASQLVLERSIRALRRMGATITISLSPDDGQA